MIADVKVLRPGAGRAVVEFTGEHDIETRSEVRELFTRLVEQNQVVVADLSEALFIDSTFLHNLAQAHRLAQTRGTYFRLQLGTAPIVRKALEITGLLDHLDCFPDREQALSSH